MSKLQFSRILALVLALCVFLVSPLRVAATGLEGAILGGGLALSIPEVALLLLAAFGVCYAVDNADAVGDALVTALEIEAQNQELNAAVTGVQLQLLEDWWTQAKTGAIELASAPAWILDAIKNWAAGFISNDSYITQTSSYPISIPLSPGGFLDMGTEFNYGFSSDEGISGYGVKWFHGSQNDDGSYYVCKHWILYSTNEFRQVCQYGSSGSLRSTSNSDSYKITVDGITYFYRGLDTHQYFSYSNLSDPFFTGAFDSSDFSTNTYTVLYAAISGDLDTVVTENIYPSKITGGIANQLNSGVDMTMIGIPDVKIPGADVFPVNKEDYETEAAAVTDFITASLISGDMTWEQYWDYIGVLNPSIGASSPTVTLTDSETGAVTGEYELTDFGVAEVPVEASPIATFAIDLTDVFPFCIPFDIYEFFTILVEEPVAPVFHWEIQDLAGNVYAVDVDLSPWDSHAALFRDVELLLFILGLMWATRKIIKW